MKRAPFLMGLLAATGWAAPGCSGDEFTATSDGDGNADGGDPNGSGGASGAATGGSGGGTGGSNSGGRSNGGSAGSSSGGSATGGEAGQPSGGRGNGGTGNGGKGGMAGAPIGGAGGVSGMAGRSGSGGVSGSGGGKGGTAGKGGSAGTGGSGSAGTGGKGGTAGTGGSAGKGGTGGNAGTAGTAGAAGAGGDDTCPVSPPPLGSMCSGELDCSYGAHPIHWCREIRSCNGSVWLRTQTACPAPGSCDGATTPPIVGEECTPEGYQCQLDQTVYCLCAPYCATVCTALPVWHCFGPPPGCPPVLPNLGQPCGNTASCIYGTCSSDTAITAVCQTGYWEWRGANCPQ